MTPFFSINFDWCAQQNLLTAWIHWQTTAAVCPTWFFLLLFKLWWLILLASSQNTLRSWNNYTPFSRTYYCVKFISHWRACSPDIFWQFCGESKMFSRFYSSSLFFYQFLSLYRSNSFRFSMKLSFNLHSLACHIALKLTLSNAPFGGASHLATGHVSKSKGAIERLFGICLGFHEHFTQQWFKMVGKKVCDGSIKEEQLILRRK